MERHSAKITLNESFFLGKNTGKDSGIEVELFSKGDGNKPGPKLGTLRVGQGSVTWSTVHKRKTVGKKLHSKRWSLEKFAELMDNESFGSR